MHLKVSFVFLAGITLATECSAQFHVEYKTKQLQKSVTGKQAPVPTIGPAPLNKIPAANLTPPPSAPGIPTIKNILPQAQVARGTVVITGTNFDAHTTVTFGGIPAKSIRVSAEGNSLTAVIGKSGGSVVVVTNEHGPSINQPEPAFTFVPGAPTIKSVYPSDAAAGSNVIIRGTNFQPGATVTFEKKDAANPTVLSPTEILATVPASATSDSVTVTVNGVTATYPYVPKPLDANADLTVPNLGQGITIIPTPTFTYTNVHLDKRLTFTSSIWANSFGTDSTRQAVGSKLLLAQTSLFGFKIAGNYRFTHAQDNLDVAIYGEENLLVKKVSYYYANAKTNTDFNPLVLQTRVGPTISLYNSIFLGAYENILSVESENANVSSFFQTGGKTVFTYTEVDVAGMFPVSQGSKQQIKAEIDLIMNNKDANYFYNSSNSVIPYFKIGYYTGL